MRRLSLILPRSPFPRVPPHRLPELMDRPDCDLEALRDALKATARAGRWLGAERLLRDAAFRLLEGRRPGPLRLLDVGSGAGHGGRRLSRALAVRGWSPRLVLADLHPGALKVARNHLRNPSARWAPREVDLVRLCGSALPFGDASVDLAFSSTTLHHLERKEAVRLLAELSRVSRVGWVVTDLRRSRAAYAAARLLAVTVWRRNRFPRRDAPVSIRRAFTPREVRELAARAGVDGARMVVRPFQLAVAAPGRGAAGDGHDSRADSPPGRERGTG